MFGIGLDCSTKGLDRALASMLASAGEMAEAVMACAPDDRPVSNEELQKVEDKVISTVLNSYRQQSAVRGGSHPLVRDPIEERFRRAFHERFAELAPLAGIHNDNCKRPG